MKAFLTASLRVVCSSVILVLSLFLDSASGEPYTVVINQSSSIIHTSGGQTGEGYGDIQIWGTIQITTGSGSIQFDGSGVVTNDPYEEFTFPEYPGSFDGFNFSGSEETFPPGNVNSYSGTFDGTTLQMSGTYNEPAFDGYVYDYTITNLASASAVPTLSQWGLISFTLVLAIAGAVLMRRRRRV